jgi:ppGpp synthetase/RelA/SpoT-type nucleotidyltranferase
MEYGEAIGGHDMDEPIPCTNEWAHEQVAEYARRRAEYVLLGQVLEEVLTRAADTYAPLAIVQVRAKGIPSFAEKCLRKCHKYSQPVDQLTDLCGARIIVHTQEQVERISRFLEERFEIDWANSEDIGKRLKTSEFGYRSVHYIVTFKRGAFSTKDRDFPVKVPARLYGGKRGMKNPRAEVQVRTLLQHAWADIGHDLLYKSGVEAPEVWLRDYARFAAMLETADGVASGVAGRMRRFISSYSAYMTREQMNEELELLKFVREHDPDDIHLALRTGGVANAAERWQDAVEALAPFERTGDSAVLRELGIAHCGKGRGRPRGAVYVRGQKLLGQASGDPDIGAPALLALAASWRGVNDEEARTVFSRAFEADPDDPYGLAGYLEYQIAFDKNLGSMTAAGPAVSAALETCESRVRASVDIPGGYFTAGFLNLLRGDGFAALDAYAKAIDLATAPHQMATALDSLKRIACVSGDVSGHAWAVRLLQLGLAARFSDEASAAEVRALATRAGEPLAQPVVVVAGGCDPTRAEQFERYRDMLVRGFAEYCGTVISGGTREGVSGFVGDAAENNPRIHAASYLPRLLPLDASLDPRYAEVRAIDDAGFTPMGPLQAWTDIIASGIDPARVRLLGINGGRISAAEYRIALALGATVALAEDSGREAARMLPDQRWGSAKRLINMPVDAASVRAYVGGTCVPVPEELREAIARDMHDVYRKDKERELRPDEPALADWDQLIPEFRQSSLQHAGDIFAKLALIGLEAVKTENPEPVAFVIPEEQVESLAEIEHGRWNIERLLEGWRHGPTKDVKARVSPYLVPWSALPDKIREYDRQFIRAIPATLAKHGYEVRIKG